MELLLHVLRAVAAVGHSVNMLGWGERAVETQFSCPRGGPAMQPDQEALLRWPKLGTAICNSSGMTREKGISHLVTVVLK